MSVLALYGNMVMNSPTGDNMIVFLYNTIWFNVYVANDFMLYGFFYASSCGYLTIPSALPCLKGGLLLIYEFYPKGVYKIQPVSFNST